MDNTQLFDGLAAKYQKHRPHYPDILLACLRQYVQEGRQASWPDKPLAVDVGSGTGISTRLLERQIGSQYVYYGVEPGKDMRATAIAETPAAAQIAYLDGRAESLPFEGESAALVFAAQAAHWFDRPAFYAEARRILLPAGTLAIIYNNRLWKDSPAMEAYEQFLEKHNPDYARHYRNFQFDQELPAVPGFKSYKRIEHHWQRLMTLPDFIELSLSVTKMNAIVERLGEEEVVTRLHTLLAGFSDSAGELKVPYMSELFMIRLSPPGSRH